MLRSLVACVVALLLVMTGDAAAATKPAPLNSVERELLGTWRLKSFVVRDSAGNETKPLGSKPVGKITYSPDRTMWALVARRGATKELPDANWYTGTFRVNRKAGTVIHTVDASNITTWEGTEQVRKLELSGNRLTLSIVSADSSSILRWRRAQLGALTTHPRPGRVS